jgi:electron transfer flavoprotein alpha subunit
MSAILVFAEQRGGKLHPAVAQLVTAARQLDSAAPIDVCVIGHEVGAVAKAAGAAGVNRILACDDPRLALYRPQPYTAALVEAITRSKPRVLLLAATFMGRDLAPRVAVRTRAALATDCTVLQRQGDALVVQRPVYMGKVLAEVKLAPDCLNIVSVRPNTFPAAAAGGGAAVENFTLQMGPPDEKLVNRQLVSTTSGVKDVAEADIIVSGGRSLKSQDNFKILYELAHTLDAAVGASRAACDAGYQPHSRQVGLTGKTVTPKLYMAFGIDGAIQHLAGMRGSKVIVAVNTKKEAPIFSVADYGCVADLFVMAPLLNEEFKKVLGK